MLESNASCMYLENMKTFETDPNTVRRPVFPTALHKDAANVVQEYFSIMPNVDTVLAVNSCARGQAVDDSDLDFAILAKLGTTAVQMESIQANWESFSLENPKIRNYKAYSRYAHLHLDVISGEYKPTVLEVGVASDYFELEIGNQVCYSAPMGEIGEHFRTLQEKWLPFYDEKLRDERFSMMKSGCQYDLDHIPRYMARQLYFHAFDILCKAFQEYLQVLFIGRGVYPIAYNKWIRYQIESLLGDYELYDRLPPVLSVSDIESGEVNKKAEMLQELLDQVQIRTQAVNPLG